MVSSGRRAAVVWFCALAACKDEPTPPAEPSWSVAFDAEGVGALSGVWGSGPDDVWMVGGQVEAAEIYHFDGSAWSPVEAPAVPLLVWVYGFGPDDVWAVGTEGGVVHWDGATWATLDPGTTGDLWGVWGTSSNDLWVVGGAPDSGEPTLLHYDGATFTPHTLTAENNDRGAHSLFKVWGIDGRVWAVGQYGLIVEWDGMEWLQQGTGASDDFVSLWGTSADHVLAVGGRSGALLSRFDGATWTSSEPIGLAGLSAVAMVDPDLAVIGGVHGWVGRVDPNADGGDPIAETSVDTVDVHAMWSDGAGKVYAVAGHFFDPYYGTPLVRAEAQ